MSNLEEKDSIVNVEKMLNLLYNDFEQYIEIIGNKLIKHDDIINDLQNQIEVLNKKIIYYNIQNFNKNITTPFKRVFLFLVPLSVSVIFLKIYNYKYYY